MATDDEGWIDAEEDGWVDETPPVEKPAKFGDATVDNYIGPELKKPEKEMGLVPAMAHKFLQGAAQNYSDEGMGAYAATKAALEPGKDDAEANGITWKAQSPVEAYRESRDVERDNIRRADHAYPKAGTAAEIGGNAVGTAAMGLISPVLTNPYALAVANAVGSAGGDLTTPEGRPEFAKDAVVNTALATGLTKALGKVMDTDTAKKFMSWIVNAGTGLRESAQEGAVKTIAKGNNLNHILGDKSDAASDQISRMRSAGKYLLDEPQEALGGKPILTAFPRSRASIADRIETVEQKAGKALGDIKADLGSRAQPQDLIPQADLAARAETELLPLYKTGHGAGDARKYLQGEIDKALKNGDIPRYDLENLEKLKTTLFDRGETAFTGTTADNPQVLAKFGSFIKDVGEEQADNLVKKYAPELAGEFQAAKAAYSKIAGPSKAIAKEMGRDLRNNTIGLRASNFAGGGGDGAAGVISNVVEKGKTAALTQFLMNHMPRAGAVATNGMGKLLESTPDLAQTYAVNPAVRTLFKDPEQAQAFAEWLQNKTRENE